MAPLPLDALATIIFGMIASLLAIIGILVTAWAIWVPRGTTSTSWIHGSGAWLKKLTDSHRRSAVRTGIF